MLTEIDAFALVGNRIDSSIVTVTALIAEWIGSNDTGTQLQQQEHTAYRYSGSIDVQRIDTAAAWTYSNSVEYSGSVVVHQRLTNTTYHITSHLAMVSG